MAKAVTIKRPDIVALIYEAADRLTGGNKTAVVAAAKVCYSAPTPDPSDSGKAWT